MSDAASILLEAAEIVGGARNATHGDKERSFHLIASMWGAYLDHEIEPEDVAIMMVLLKAARAKSGQPVRDHFVDMAGYAAIAGEIA